MPNLTSVHVTGGIPDAGTGTVSTIDNLISVGMTVTAQISGGTSFVSGGTVTAQISGGTSFISGGNITAIVSGTTVISGTATATLNQGGAALSSTNGIFSNLLLGNATVSSSNPVQVQLVSWTANQSVIITGTAVVSGTTFISGGTVTAQISGGTSFISGGNITAIVSGTTFISGGTVTAQISGGTSFISGGTVTAQISGGTSFISGGNITAVISGTANLNQAGAALSSTNGAFFNVLYNNILVTTANGLPVNIVSGTVSVGNVTAALNQGGSAISSTNGIFANMLLGNAAISSTNPLMIEGDTASAVTDANNPIKVGGLAKSAQPTGVTDGQRVNALFDLLGKQIVVNSIRNLKSNFYTTIATTGETVLIPAISTAFVDVYGAVIANKSGSTILMTFKDSTGGNTQFELEVPSFDTRGFMMPESAAFKQTAQNTTWTVTPSQATSISLSLLYVKNTTS